MASADVISQLLRGVGRGVRANVRGEVNLRSRPGRRGVPIGNTTCSQVGARRPSDFLEVTARAPGTHCGAARAARGTGGDQGGRGGGQPGAPPAGGLGGFRAIVPSAVPTRRPPFSHSTVTTAVRFDSDTTRPVARSTPGRAGPRSLTLDSNVAG